MDISHVQIQNSIFLRKDLNKEDIKKYLQSERVKGVVEKYPFKIFFNLFHFDKADKIEDNYNYALKNIKVFLECCDNAEEYSEEDINLFSLYFSIKNNQISLENSKKYLNFIDDKFVKYKTDKEISLWFQEEIELNRINLYSIDIEKYLDGTITRLLEENAELISNHNNNLLYEYESN